jgi:DNA primase
MSMTNYFDIWDEIKHIASLSDEMEEHHITLITKSSGKKMCCCPFHDDSTPSMIINATDEIETFKCFGCGAKGSVVDFIMKRRGVGLVGALEYFKKKYALTTNIEEMDIKKLIERTNKRKKPVAITSLMIMISRQVREFLKTSNDKKSDFLKLKTDLVLTDEAAYVENVEYLNKYYKQIIKTINDIKIYNNRIKCKGD